METWAKKLEDALPNAGPCVIDDIINSYCPNDLFGEDAPESRCPIPDTYDAKVCLNCWNSCDHFCKYLRGKQND